jgi:release factor glutamine methyltransferase
MTEEEQAAYHLGVQANEIAEMSARRESIETTLAGIDITVYPHVYPGGIDSELTSKAIGDVTDKTVLDLCTGTGIVAIKAALAGAEKVVAVDLNPEAVKNAVHNANKLGLSQVEVLEGSLFEPVGDATFDVIAINPPYTGKKPSNKTEICFWDEDNNTTRQFFREFKQHLNPDGRAYLAWADFSSIELIEGLARENGVSLELVESQSTKSGLATFLVYQLLAA